MMAIAGIGFAVALMFQQRGFNHALFDSTVAIIEKLDADIIVFHPSRFALTSESRFPLDTLSIAASLPEVQSAQPLYIENIKARFRTTGKKARPIRVLGFDLDRPMLLPDPDVASKLVSLGHPQTAIMDRLSKPEYGIELDTNATFPQSAELLGKKLSIVGSFLSGRDFAHDGNLMMSSDNFESYFGLRAADPLSVVDLGVVKVDPAIPIRDVVNRLQKQLGEGATVMTKHDFSDREVAFWSRNTPIGIIFAIGAVMGFVVGVIICYQILANDIGEHLGEFATLRAMGYGNAYFYGLVIRQALYLSLLGFLPGLAFAWVLFRINASVTGLLMNMTWDRVLFVLGLTVTMCIVSGLLALRKLIAADPASLF